MVPKICSILAISCGSNVKRNQNEWYFWQLFGSIWPTFLLHRIWIEKKKNVASLNCTFFRILAHCVTKVILIWEHAIKHEFKWFGGLFWIFQAGTDRTRVEWEGSDSPGFLLNWIRRFGNLPRTSSYSQIWYILKYVVLFNQFKKLN